MEQFSAMEMTQLAQKGQAVQLETPLDQVLETGAHVRVLRALVALPPGFDASARDIARRAGVAHTTASRVLQSLGLQRLVSVQHVARADLYQLNDDHILAPRIRELFAGEATLREQLIDYLRSEVPRRVGKAQGAFLFGSASRGTTRSSSDIDMAIVGPEHSEAQLESELSALSDIVRERFGSELNVIIDSGKRSGRGRPKLWQRIEKEGIPLLNPRSRRG